MSPVFGTVPHHQGPSCRFLLNTAWMVERIPLLSKLSSVGRQDDLQEQGDLPQGYCPHPQAPGDLCSEECLFLKSGKSLNKRGSFSFSRAGRKSEVDKNHHHWWLTSLWGLLLTD